MSAGLAITNEDLANYRRDGAVVFHGNVLHGADGAPIGACEQAFPVGWRETRTG